MNQYLKLLECVCSRCIGTGKTSRYFGIKGLEKNATGIVNNVISRKSGGDGSKIQLGYFVCYGQKSDISNITSSDFNELLLFYKIKNMSNFEEGSELIPYCLEKVSSSFGSANNLSKDTEKLPIFRKTNE